MCVLPGRSVFQIAPRVHVIFDERPYRAPHNAILEAVLVLDEPEKSKHGSHRERRGQSPLLSGFEKLSPRRRQSNGLTGTVVRVFEQTKWNLNEIHFIKGVLVDLEQLKLFEAIVQ